MPRLAIILLVSLLAPVTAMAQTTWCQPVGGTVMCRRSGGSSGDDGANAYQQGVQNLANALQEQIYERQLEQQQQAYQQQLQQQQEQLRQLQIQQDQMRQEQQARAQEDVSARRQLEAFAADPRHPFYGIIRNEMAELIRSGVAVSLQQAYDMACARSMIVRSLESQGVGAQP